MSGSPYPKPEPRVRVAKGLERRSELARGDKPLARSEARPGSGSTLRPAAPSGRARGRRADESKLRVFDEELREEWKAKVCHDAGGRDQVTGAGLLADWQAHHVIEQSVIYSMRRRLGLDLHELAALLWDRRDGMALNKTTHDRHDDGTTWAIPRACLRSWHWEYARELDALLPGTQWATARLERDYPDGEA